MKLKKVGAFFAMIGLGLGLGITTAAAGGSCNGCKIKSLGSGPYYDHICTVTCIFIDIEQAVGGKPACSSNSSWDFVLDISTPSGRATYALLLAAQSSGQSVYISGSNYCTYSPAGVAEDFYFAATIP